jgi:hypothetical protein
MYSAGEFAETVTSDGAGFCFIYLVTGVDSRVLLM